MGLFDRLFGRKKKSRQLKKLSKKLWKVLKRVKRALKNPF